MTPLSARPAYSSDQLSQYLSVVFSQSHPFHDLSKLKDAIVASPIEALSVLQTNHLSRIPWGDIGLHYSETKKLSLDADDLFRKIVVRQLGGYCMEVNAFYANVLRGLGVKLYTTAGRISNTIDGAGVKDPEGFNGWEHMVILALIEGKTYHIDVGFANYSALTPLLLEENVQGNCTTGLEARLVKRVIADNVTDQKLWVLENRDSHSNQWKAGYCFGETEFLPQDFYTLNYRTMTDPASWFTTTFILTRILLKEGHDAELNEPQGTITINKDVLQRRIDGGETEVLMKFTSEEQRVEALEKYFFVKLTDSEVKAIWGTAAEIKLGDN